MAKFRKKPILIEAVQWEGTAESWNQIMEMGLRDFGPGDMGSKSFFINTKEGPMKVSCGDYVIKEPFDTERMFYPCKSNIFNQTYDSVDDLS